MVDTLKAPNAKQIEQALEDLVCAIMEHRARRFEQSASTKLEIISAAVLLETPSEMLRARDLVRDPVDDCLRDGARKLGKLLFQTGMGTEGMKQVLERIAAHHPKIEGRILSFLDHAFDGVGDAGDRWTC